MTQASAGQKHQQLVKDLEGLEQHAQFVDWMEGYEIKAFLMDLITILKRG